MTDDLVEVPDTATVLTEPAGRRLDCWVAARVMGHTKFSRSDYPSPDVPGVMREYYFGDDGTGLEEVPLFSTDDADALKALDRAEHYTALLSSRLGNLCQLVHAFNGAWRLDLMTPGGLVAGPEAGTRPLAICRALLVLGPYVQGGGR